MEHTYSTISNYKKPKSSSVHTQVRTTIHVAIMQNSTIIITILS